MLTGLIVGVVIALLFAGGRYLQARRGSGLPGELLAALAGRGPMTVAELVAAVGGKGILGRGRVLQALAALQQAGRVRLLDAPPGTPRLQKHHLVRYERV